MLGNKYKLVVLGCGSVGKSASIIQFIQNHFIIDYEPTIEDSYRKQIKIDDDTYLLDILDTAGQEEYSTMRYQYMRTGEGFLLIYDITKRDTFNEITNFREHIYRCKDKDFSYKIPMVLCGNKLDLSIDRQVTTLEGKNLAKIFGCPFFESSAKMRYSIEEIWFELIKQIKQNRSKSKKNKKNNNV